MDKGAVFSSCRHYRYSLWRYWSDEDRKLVVVSLNPSRIADESADDLTIRRCIGYAKRWKLGGLYMLNLFGYCADSPKYLMAADDPIGADNIDGFNNILLNHPEPIVLCAWGGAWFIYGSG